MGSPSQDDLNRSERVGSGKCAPETQPRSEASHMGLLTRGCRACAPEFTEMRPRETWA